MDITLPILPLLILKSTHFSLCALPLPSSGHHQLSYRLCTSFLRHHLQALLLPAPPTVGRQGTLPKSQIGSCSSLAFTLGCCSLPSAFKPLFVAREVSVDLFLGPLQPSLPLISPLLSPTSSVVLNKIDKSRYLFLIPNLKRRPLLCHHYDVYYRCLLSITLLQMKFSCYL